MLFYGQCDGQRKILSDKNSKKSYYALAKLTSEQFWFKCK